MNTYSRPQHIIYHTQIHLLLTAKRERRGSNGISLVVRAVLPTEMARRRLEQLQELFDTLSIKMIIILTLKSNSKCHSILPLKSYFNKTITKICSNTLLGPPYKFKSLKAFLSIEEHQMPPKPIL